MTSAQRNASLPDVPTIAEQGQPGFEATAWFGVLAPAATPAPIVQRLGAEMNAIALDADFRERMAALGADRPALTPDGGTEPRNLRRLPARRAGEMGGCGEPREYPRGVTTRRA